MKVNVQDCYQRGDGQWVVVFRTVPGARDRSQALSPVAVEVGRDVLVRDGKVVK